MTKADETHWLFLGLGANVGDRAANLLAAIEGVGRVLDAVRVSPWYETAPVGVEEQPDFLNLVLMGRTRLAPHAVLRLALGVECALGRRRNEGPRFGPRPIDIDLLLLGRSRVARPDLQLPHPRLAERAFVLAPLRDLSPQLVIPRGPAEGLTVEAMWSALPAAERAGVQRIAPPGASART